MPIETDFNITSLNQAKYHEINEKVIGLAFDVHNELGRSCHEKIYQNALKAACLTNGLFSCVSEAAVRVIHGSFSKSYFLDLLVADGIIYEAKAVETFHENHRKQLLNYLMLLGLHHGTLLNFKTRSVQHEFVSARLTPEKRRQFSIEKSEWNPTNEPSRELMEFMRELLTDWGAFLDTSLYIDAITHHFGSSDRVVSPIEISSNGISLGYQNVRLLDEETAFKLTASTKNISYYKRDFFSFLSHTNLKTIQWINLNHHSIEFRTLSK